MFLNVTIGVRVYRLTNEVEIRAFCQWALGRTAA